MKIVRRISFFLLVLMLLTIIGKISFIYAERYFYPNKETYHEDFMEQLLEQFETVQFFLNQNEQGRPDKEEPGIADSQMIEAAMIPQPTVTADTVFLVERIQLSSGEIEECKETAPIQYLGMNREELAESLQAYDQNPPLTELEQGFSAIELSSFSKERVSICKYYRNPDKQVYYVMVRDHFVVVYKEDKRTMYMNTDIRLDSLPYDLQREIIDGKKMEGEEALYNFLESYSS